MENKRSSAKIAEEAGNSNTLLFPLVTASTANESTTAKNAAELGFVIMEITRGGAKSANKRGISSVVLFTRTLKSSRSCSRTATCSQPT